MYSTTTFTSKVGNNAFGMGKVVLWHKYSQLEKNTEDVNGICHGLATCNNGAVLRGTEIKKGKNSSFGYEDVKMIGWNFSCWWNFFYERIRRMI